ncbi:MAG: hypothetical protein ACPGJE_03550 [Wenzhouxiangellaceae bacterium]
MNPSIDPIMVRKIALQILILLAVLFGAVTWNQRPEGALVWLTGMLTLPLGWLLVSLTGALPGPDRPESRQHIYNSLVGAGVLVTGALGVVMAVTLEAVPEDWSTRFGMLTSALVLIVIGNGLPKKIEPGCTRSRYLPVQRLLGWTFVITGLALAALWLSPLRPETAKWISVPIYAAMLLVGGLGARRLLRRNPTD